MGAWAVVYLEREVSYWLGSLGCRGFVQGVRLVSLDVLWWGEVGLVV